MVSKMNQRLRLSAIFILLLTVVMYTVAFAVPPTRPKYTRVTKLELTEGVIDFWYPNQTQNPTLPRFNIYWTPTVTGAGYTTIDANVSSPGNNPYDNGFRINLGTNFDGTTAETPWSLHAGSGASPTLAGYFSPGEHDHGVSLGLGSMPWGGLSLLGRHNSNWSSPNNHSGPIQWFNGIDPTGATPTTAQYSIFSVNTGRLRFQTGYSNIADSSGVNSFKALNTAAVELFGQDPDRDGDGTVERFVTGRYIQIATKAVTSTASDATLIDTTGAIGSPTITTGTNFDTNINGTSGIWRIGQTYNILARGIYTTDGSAGNATWKIKLGATTLATTTAIALPNSATNKQWTIKGTFTARTIGATGTIIGQADLTLFTATSTATQAEMPMTGVATIDMTTTLTWDVTTNMDNAGNTITATNVTVELM